MQIRTYYLAFLLRRTFTTFLCYVANDLSYAGCMSQLMSLQWIHIQPELMDSWLVVSLMPWKRLTNPHFIWSPFQGTIHVSNIHFFKEPFNSTVSNLDFFRAVNEEMVQESKRARAFRGIECHANYSPSNQYLWSFPFLGSTKWTWESILPGPNNCVILSCTQKLKKGRLANFIMREITFSGSWLHIW